MIPGYTPVGVLSRAAEPTIGEMTLARGFIIFALTTLCVLVFFLGGAFAQIPTCATAIKATPMGPFPCSITATFTDNSTNEDGFLLQRQLNGGTWQDMIKTAPNITAIIDATLQQSTTVDNVYNYRVVAFNSAGQSAPSNIASFTVPKAVSVPAPASSLTVTFNNATGTIKTGSRTINLKNQSGSMALTGDITVVDIQ